MEAMYLCCGGFALVFFDLNTTLVNFRRGWIKLWQYCLILPHSDYLGRTFSLNGILASCDVVPVARLEAFRALRVLEA